MNGIHNSSDTCYIALWKALYHDVVIQARENGFQIKETQLSRDLITVDERCAREGISFLTKTLPAIGKRLDAAYSSANPDEKLVEFPGLKKTSSMSLVKTYGGPRFLAWIWETLLDVDSKTVAPVHMEKPCGELASQQVAEINTRLTLAYKYARQLLYFLYKLELPYTADQEMAVVERFVANDIQVKQLDLDARCPLLRRARTLISQVFSTLPEDSLVDIIPGHGPGSVSTGQKGWGKYLIKSAANQLRDVYSDEYFRASVWHLLDTDELQWEDQYAKCVLVPKDSRGPRLISCEPLSLQWIQQGIKNVIVPYLENNVITRGRINFTDQTINQRLAMASSLNRAYETLDLKDASDLVSLHLVEYLFSGTMLLPYLRASRSVATLLPDGNLMPLHKFAPMGSALCFPIEAVVFWALATACVSTMKGFPTVGDAATCVYVYGDDLIVPSGAYDVINEYFPRWGLNLNQGKCCIGDGFRESCGVDAFLGVDITPLRLRALWSRRRNPVTIAAYVSFRNRAYVRNYHVLVNILDAMLEGVYGKLPRTTDATSASSLLCLLDRHCPYQAHSPVKYRFNKRFHRYEAKGWKVVPRGTTSPDGYSSLMRFIIRKNEVRDTLYPESDLRVLLTRDDCSLRRSWVPVCTG